MSASTKRLAPLAASGVIVTFDRLTKIAIQHSMSALDAVSVLPGWLQIVHTENRGAAFGVLADGNPVLRSSILIGISALVMFFVAYALLGRTGASAPLFTRFGLGLILGGAGGNLYDRVVHGRVTDFIEVYHGNWSFPAFNVADSAITIGAILLLIDLLRPKRKQEEENPELAHK